MPRTPTILRHRVAFTGRVFHVDHDRVALPSGHTVDMDVVRHRGSVVLVPQPSPGRVVLIRQFRYAINRWIWELPAGSLEAGEAPGKAARRECEEEIGLAPQRLTRLGSVLPDARLLRRADDVLPLRRASPAGPPARGRRGRANRTQNRVDRRGLAHGRPERDCRHEEYSGASLSRAISPPAAPAVSFARVSATARSDRKAFRALCEAHGPSFRVDCSRSYLDAPPDPVRRHRPASGTRPQFLFGHAGGRRCAGGANRPGSSGRRTRRRAWTRRRYRRGAGRDRDRGSRNPSRKTSRPSDPARR